MAIFGKSSDSYIHDANKAIDQGYNNASSWMQPYTEHAGEDFNNGRNFLYNAFSHHFAGGNPNDNFFDYLNMSPDEMLSHAMSGYEESPMAKYQNEYAMSAANNAMTAQGMGGSSNNEFLDAEIGNIIGTQDMDHYLNSLMKSFGIQHDILDDFNKQTSSLESMFSKMMGLENKASGTMASNAMRAGQEHAMADERGAMDNRNQSPIKEAASLGSALWGMFEGPVKTLMKPSHYGDNQDWWKHMGGQ